MKNVLKITAVAFCFILAENTFAQTDKKQEPVKKEEKKPAKKQAAKKDNTTTSDSKQKMAITEQGVNDKNKKKPASGTQNNSAVQPDKK